MKRLILAGLACLALTVAVGLTACGSTTSATGSTAASPASVQASVDSAVSSALTPANIQTVCGWVQFADVAFNVAAPFAKLPASVVADEQKADASATTLCAQPYPTDLETLQGKILAVVAQIQGVTPSS